MDAQNAVKKDFISVDDLIKDALERSRKQLDEQLTPEKQAAMFEDFKKRVADLPEGR